MTIEKAILSAKEPKETNTAWVQPKGDSLQLNIFNNGKWRPIAGGGNSSSDSSGCGCYDVVVKGIAGEGGRFNYTVEKGNFEEVYNGILQGKIYSFKISEFLPNSEEGGYGYINFHYYPNNIWADSTVSKIEMKKRTNISYFVWTPEGISVVDTGGK